MQIITHTNIQRHVNMPAEQYFKLTGYSHSFLKREVNGVTPMFVATPKVKIGALVDKILTDPSSVTAEDMQSDYWRASSKIAAEISNMFGSVIARLQPQVSYTADINYSGLTMRTTGRLDLELPKLATIDLKVTEATSLPALIEFMGYKNQLWNYSKMAQTPKAYILAYSTKLKRCLPLHAIDVSSNYNEFWANGILKFGSC